jgi:Ala-tRNA(Pro) deacylase
MPSPDDFSRAPEKPLFALFGRLGLACPTAEHAPVATVAESKAVKTHIPGVHSKNLFMKDKKGSLVLISAAHDTELPLNQLHKQIGTQRLSFTDAGLLWEALGVTPGSVTAFALMNDAAGRVRFVLDAALDRAETLNFHPLRNDMTTSITRADFGAFLVATGHAAEIVDFTGLKSD